MIFYMFCYIFCLQEVTIWAYPKMQGIYEDALICCVKENPEPVIFKLICYGVRPEIELDKKIMHFEKVLLHRYFSISYS